METILKSFLDIEGRLKAFPAKRKMKVYALIFLAGKLEKGTEYSEKEINEALRMHHTFNDPATLRREMCDYGFLKRTPDGRVYRLSETQPTLEELGF